MYELQKKLCNYILFEIGKSIRKNLIIINKDCKNCVTKVRRLDPVFSKISGF